MGLFSSTPPLDSEFQAFISPFWTISEVGKRDYNTGVSKVAGAQDAVKSALGPREMISTIVPCIAQNTGYDGLLVITSERIMHVKRKIQKQMQKSDLADVKQMVTPMGHFLLQLISRKAAPFASFAGDRNMGQSAMKFWDGTIQVPISTETLMEHAITVAQS